MIHTLSRAIAVAALAVVTVSAVSCTRTTVQNPNKTDYDLADTTASLDFWHTLPGRSAVSNAEGINGVMQFVDHPDGMNTYEDRVAKFKEMGWISESFDEEPNLAMQRGTLAKMLVNALDIDGGVMMRVTNKAGRYAARELIYMQIMPASTPQQAISGLEYIGVIQKAQDYKLLREMNDAAKEAAKGGAQPTGEAKPGEGQSGEEPEAPPPQEQPGIPTPG